MVMDVSGGTPKRILVVCTANVCRSPVAEHLLRRHLEATGHDAVVTSAGVIGGRLDVHRYTVDAARMGGIDLTGHRSRLLTQDLIATEGADLVIGMAREHVAQVVGLDKTAWPRTFTLKSLVRRSTATPVDVADGDWQAWLEALGADRHANELVRPDPADDVRDAYGLPAAAHMAMTADLNTLCQQLSSQLPRVGSFELSCRSVR